MASPGQILAGLGQQVFGGITNQNALQWYQNALMNVLNNMQGASATGTEAANPISLFLQQVLSGASGKGTEYLNGGANGGGFNWQLGDALQSGGTDLAKLFLSGGMPNIPGFEDQQNNLTGLTGQTNQIMSALAPLLASGGKTNENMDLFDRFRDLGTGRNVGVDSLKDIGTRLLNSGGVNATTANYQDRGNQVLNAGGYDALLNGATGAASNIIGQNGSTPTNMIAQLLGAKGVQGEGTNEATDFLTRRGAEILGGDPLLSMDEAVNIARNEAAVKNKQMGEGVRRQILQRSGGPGAVLSGRAGSDLADFADQALENEADAVGKARQNQQALQLALFGQGKDLIGTGQTVANQRLGTFGDILRGGEGIAAQRLLSALGTLPDIANSATSRASAYGNLGLGAGQLELSRLMGGGDLTQNYIQSLLQGLSGANNVQQGQVANLFGAASGSNQGINTNANILNQVVQNALAGGNFNLNQAGAFNNARNQNFGQQIDFSQMLGGQAANAAGGLNDLAKAWLGYAQTGLGGMSGLFNNYQPNNPWSGLAGMDTKSMFGK